MQFSLESQVEDEVKAASKMAGLGGLAGTGGVGGKKYFFVLFFFSLITLKC